MKFMSQWFLKVNLILKLLKNIWNFLLLLDYSYNVSFHEKCKEFIDEYKEGLINIHIRNIATNAKNKLIEKFNKTNKAPISDDYIYEHIELDDDLKPYLNLQTPPPKTIFY